MEELLQKQRKEQRDLIAKTTQKKKSASKKTRKGINEECDRLEKELKERHAQEVLELQGNAPQPGDDVVADDLEDEAEEKLPDESKQANEDDIAEDVAALDLDSAQSAQGRKRNRQKDRLARRAAEQQKLVEEAEAEAKAMPDRRADEKAAMKEAFKKRGLYEKIVHADGHCLYAAIADQVRQRGGKLEVIPLEGKEDDYRVVRKVAADYIAKHPDDFVPFLEEDLDSYVVKVRDTGEWGGQVELMALAQAYDLHICVLQGDGSVVDIGEGDDDKKIWLAYYKHSFGLGEHYNSLRPLPTS
jgi:OTU domain-containing protein 6